MTMSKLLKRTRKCCLKIFQRLSISTPNGDCDIPMSSSGGGPGGVAARKSTTSKLARLGPPFGRQTVSYTQHTNRTPNRTPTRTANARIMPASSGRSPDVNQRSFNMGIRSEDNSTTYDELSFEEDHGFRVNLYRSPTARSFDDDDDDFDRIPADSDRYHLDNDNARDADPRWTNGRLAGGDHDGDDVDQWPCQMAGDDTEYPIIFVENRVYIGPNDKAEFKCYDLGGQTKTDQQQLPAAASFSHSTPQRKKKVLFEKVNYEKYKKVAGVSHRPHHRTPSSPARHQSRAYQHYQNHAKSAFDEAEDADEEADPFNRNAYFSGYESERSHHDYGPKWCQDLLNWSREAAEFQRQHQHESGFEEMSSSGPVAVEENGSSNWFHDKFRGSSAVARYNKMSATDDSGVVCQFEEADDDWRRDHHLTTEGGGKTAAGDNNGDPDSWNALKQRVFEPPEVLNDDHRLGRRCSCNSMCTSLCTLETWLDDETFDNSFNEELERRCGISTN